MSETKNISAYRQSLRDRILEVAMQAFREKGIKAVKMDDIAASLTISKRTLYEVYENKLRLRFHKEYGNLPVELVLPVPLTVVNYLDSPKPWSGKIIAPPKFREFLITKLAYRLAKELGVASAVDLKTDVAEAYNLLVKNYPKQQHVTDFNKRISDTLRRPVNTMVSSAGFYGGTNG